MTLPDPADATSADVRRAIHRKFFTSGPSADPVEVAMSIVGPVLDGRDKRIAERDALIAQLVAWRDRLLSKDEAEAIPEPKGLA